MQDHAKINTVLACKDSYIKQPSSLGSVEVCGQNNTVTKNTGCPRRNVQYFGRVFLMLNYTDKTQNTYIQS